MLWNRRLDNCASWAVGEQGKVVGLDFSENMLSVGKQKVEALQLKQVELLHGNAMELPFEDNTFDYVTIGFGLRNVPDYMHVLKEMTRVVKPGGKVICLETSQPTMIGFRQGYILYFKYIMRYLERCLRKVIKNIHGFKNLLVRSQG